MKLGLTYADVLIVPKRTPLKSRSEAKIQSRFTRNIILNAPFVSANMATVTEHKTAIAMAREGGLGIIHQFSSIEEQAQEVRRVKRSTSFIIKNPISVNNEVTIKDAVRVMLHQGVTSLLVKKGEELVGIFTSRDYLFEDDLTKKVSQVMTHKDKLITAPIGISLEEAKVILHKHRIEKLPLLDSLGNIKGLITTKDIKRLEQWPNACRDSQGRLRVGAAIGVKDTLERSEALINAGCDVLVLDIAHAHSDFVIERLKELKRNVTVDVMVGNIATAQAARDLILAGADGLKIGIGPSPVCTTRVKAGAGVPQFTAVVDVAQVAKEYGIPVTADGGMREPGDCAKAIAAGASSIFSGTLFAGTTESPGRIILKNGKRYKRYMGSASYDGSHERKEKLDNTSYKEKINLFVEGISTLVDYKGPVSGVIENLIKGLRSAVSYCGARNISEMQDNAEFMQITAAGWHESQGRGTRLSE
jgi:IMP dehydrogenase